MRLAPLAPLIRSCRLTICFASAFFTSGCDSGQSTTGPDAPAPGDLGPLAPTVAVAIALRYDVTLDLATRVAHTDVTLRIDQAGSCIAIGFRPPAASSVSLDGDPADFTLDAMAGTLTACAARGVPFTTGAPVILGVTAEVPKTTLGKSQVGYSTKNDVNGNPFTYLVSWLDGCDHHGPCDALPNRFAHYKFTVKHDKGTQVLCPGTLTPGDTETTCDFALDGGPTYSTFGLMANPSWKVTSLGTWSGVNVTLYDYDNTDIAKSFDTKVGAAHLAWLQALLGPYPFGTELRFVVGPTYWLGFEHPGNIALSENLVAAAGQIPWVDPLRHVTMHELTHQWAGDHATLADTYDYFWKESVAEYLTYVYEDEVVDKGAGATTASEWKVEALASRYYPVPGSKPALIDYYGDAYGEGPMILFRQLEILYSRKAVEGALTTLLSSAKPARALGTEDFRKALETTTGASLQGYFDAWVRGTGKPAWPHAKIALTTQDNVSYDLNLTITTADNVKRGCAFHVRLESAGGQSMDVPVSLGVNGDMLKPILGIKPGFAVANTVLDPDNECLIFPSTGPIAPDLSPPKNPWIAPARAPGPRR